MLDLAQAVVAAVMGEDAVLGAAVADAGYWSEANAASQTEECELFITTRQDRKQRPTCVTRRRRGAVFPGISRPAAGCGASCAPGVARFSIANAAHQWSRYSAR